MSNEVVSSTALHGRLSIAPNQQVTQVMDTSLNTTLAPMRPSQFLEEKRWPPLDIMSNNQYWKKNLHTNVSTFGSTTTTSLRPVEVSFGNNTRIRENLLKLNEYHSSSKVEFDSPFRIKVTLTILMWIKSYLFFFFSFLTIHRFFLSMQMNQGTLQKEKKWLPDLQLSLSQTTGNTDDKSDGLRENKEINTKLSLS